MEKESVHIVESNGALSIEYNVRRCKKCILSENFPGIAFDEEGICSYCRQSHGWALPRAEQEKVLTQVYELIESSPQRQYDCLILFSGGKDSSYSLFVVKEILKLTPLALTIDNGFMAREVLPNMRTVLNKLNIDHLLFRPSNQFMSEMYRKSLATKEEDEKSVMYATAACGSCISVILSIGAKECISRKIPVMMGGWSPGQLTELPLLPGSMLRSISSGHFSKLQLKSQILKEHINKFFIEPDEFPALYNPLYGIDYNEQAIYESLQKIGWKKPEETDSCSSNCRLNGYLVIDHIRKYGFHPYEYELAFHVRNGAATREEALARITQVAVSSAGIDLIRKHLEEI